MVRIGTVWDRTVDVLRGRAAIMAPIVVFAILLPSIVSNAIAAYAQPSAGSAPGAAAGLLGMVVSLVLLVASIWGQLALLAIATHPATTRADATRQATARLPAALGAVLALVFLFVLLLLPVVVVLVQAGTDFSLPNWPQTLPPRTRSFVGFYFLAFMPFSLWLSARMTTLTPVVLNERRGLGAIRRSFDLTRGLTGRIVGVLLLFGIVLLVSTAAVQGVSGIVLRLMLGADARATVVFLASSIGAIVTAVMAAVAAAFTAQLYVAIVAAREPGTGTQPGSR